MLLCLLLMLSSPSSALSQSCCLSVDGNDPESAALGRGLIWATLLLLVMPFALTATVVTYFVVSREKDGLQSDLQLLKLRIPRDQAS